MKPFRYVLGSLCWLLDIVFRVTLILLLAFAALFGIALILYLGASTLHFPPANFASFTWCLEAVGRCFLTLIDTAAIVIAWRIAYVACGNLLDYDIRDRLPASWFRDSLNP